uniref:Abscission/NoCut checkpoint regulator n=1 Tax=Phallusia mammillata TaxID=59560 RepID=A0A6F9DXP6_9ASCI|nr:abscission/NoCut checkpoint regulator [Phallusia mammillata]
MSGPLTCSICTAKFGFFKKRFNCGRCNCTACKDCLSQKTTLPENPLTPVYVCRKCFDYIQNPIQSGRVSPPANFKREMAKKAETTNPQESESAEDKAIRERLMNLKESHKDLTEENAKKTASVHDIEKRLKKLYADDPKITDEEIEYRLAKLKGSRPPAIRVHSLRRTSTEDEASSSKHEPNFVQEKKLVRQYTQEIAMETDMDPSNEDIFQPNMIPNNDLSADDLIKMAQVELQQAKEGIAAGQLQDEEIQARLSEISGAPSAPADEIAGSNSMGVIDEDMDAESAMLIKQIMEEDRLDQKLIERGINVGETKKLTRQAECDPESTEDEFPWCFMCNDDATTRCLTCDRELFCKTCFRVVHRESDMRGHKTETFVNKNRTEF